MRHIAVIAEWEESILMDNEIIRQQEELLRFDSFTHDMAIEIGLMMLDQVRKEGRKIAVDISRCGQQIFHAALEGCSPDIDEWLRKKKNTVYRTFGSTLGLQVRLKGYQMSLEQALHLSPQEYVSSGGGFPIYVKNVGFIGAIVASGTSDVEEHELIVSCLSRYLHVDNCPSLLKKD